jgi:hypothetical protein
MSPDPEKPIEGLLRRYARKRRERAGEPWTVHPLTRRLWQEEVARRFPKKRTFGSRLLEFLRPGWLKPVLAVAGAAAVIVVAFILIGPNGRTDKSTTDVVSSKSAKLLVRDQPTSQLATASGTDHSNHFFTVADNSPSQSPSRDGAIQETLQSPSPVENRSAQEKQEAVPAAPPALALAEDKKDRPVSAPVAQDSVAASAPAAVAGVSSSLALSAKNEPKPSQSPGAAGQTTPGNVESFARAESDLALGKTTPAKAVVLQYGLFTASQTPLVAPPQEREALTRGVQIRSALAARPESGNTQRVLTSFNVEQAGRELRVIDSDGSVYAGPMQLTNTLAGTLNQDGRGLDAQAVSKKALERRFATQESEAPPAGSSFQVTGTNRTLNRRVVFQGVLTTNQALLAGRWVAQSAREPSGAVNGSQTNQSVQDLHLSGTAEIEGEQPVRIEASPVSK